MPNLLPNATGLDGLTGYGHNGGALAVDEAATGAPNRLAIAATTNYIHTGDADVAGLSSISAATFFDGPAGGTAGVGVVFGGPGGFYSYFNLPIRTPPRGIAKRGIASTFGRAVAKAIPVPAGATIAHIVTLSGPGSLSPRVLFRPQINAGALLECWRPGPHLNPDLPAVSWPAELEIQREGFELEPIPLRKGFEGDAGIPTNRRVSNVSRRFATCELSLDAIGRDLLDQFWRANHDEFFFVRPDNGDLCLAEWAADGDPRDSGAGPGRRTSVRLLLRDS